MATLQAEFQIAEGLPVFIKGDKHTHYPIRLSIPDAPQEAITIVYVLDGSYKNSVRMVMKGVPNFQEYITAYNDYEIRVIYRPASDPNTIKPLTNVRLSAALTHTYGADASPEIRFAIEAISRC